MKKKVDLFFKYDIEQYKAGYAYPIEASQVEIDRLLRRGCIYAEKSAKYYQEPKAEEKPVKKPIKEEVKDVDHKDTEQAKVQTKRTSKRKPKE